MPVKTRSYAGLRYRICRLGHAPEIRLQGIIGGNKRCQDSNEDDAHRHAPPESRQGVAPGKGPQATQSTANSTAQSWDLGRCWAWKSFGIGLALGFHSYW